MVFELDTKYLAAVLAEFIAEHPELTLVNSSQRLVPCWPEWEVYLTADFTVNVEGIEDDCQLRVAWEEYGDSQNEFEEFTCNPRYRIIVPNEKEKEIDEHMYCGICMMNQWYIVDDKSADKVAQHFNQTEQNLNKVRHLYNQNKQIHCTTVGCAFIIGILFCIHVCTVTRALF